MIEKSFDSFILSILLICVYNTSVVVVLPLSHVQFDPMDCSMPGFHCPSLSPRVCSKTCPLTQWCHPTISSSVISFSSCPQSFPASGPFPMSCQHFSSKHISFFLNKLFFKNSTHAPTFTKHHQAVANIHTEFQPLTLCIIQHNNGLLQDPNKFRLVARCQKPPCMSV